MLKYLLAVLILIFGAIVSMYFWIGVPKIYHEKFLEESVPHIYKNSGQSIAKIKIAAFYFVPKNKISLAIPNWNAVLEDGIKKLQKFHEFQLGHRSTITYEIYPHPITGLEDNLAYDTAVTQHGNPEALRRVAGELESRIFAPRGDLYIYDFAKEEQGVYRVMMILYEGVGSSGSENVALVSRVFLADPRYSEIGATTFSHEFYHTLGIPDHYEIPTVIPTSDDIMGSGRMKSLEKTYIDRETLRFLGL